MSFNQANTFLAAQTFRIIKNEFILNRIATKTKIRKKSWVFSVVCFFIFFGHQEVDLIFFAGCYFSHSATNNLQQKSYHIKHGWTIEGMMWMGGKAFAVKEKIRNFLNKAFTLKKHTASRLSESYFKLSTWNQRLSRIALNFQSFPGFSPWKKMIDIITKFAVQLFTLQDHEAVFLLGICCD